MSNPDIASGVCETCGKLVDTRNLYVDIIVDSYALTCPACFYKSNARNPKAYYERVKRIIPDIYDEKEYNKHKKDVLPIGDAIVMAGAITDATLKNSIGNMMAQEYFANTKINNKFNYISQQYAFQTQRTVEGEEVELLMLKAIVKFKSYLEFLEHELYKIFRKECQTVFD